LVNVIAAIVTGRPCPAVTLGTTQRETETRLGAILLAGSQIVSLDNLTSDLNDPLLCQMAEQQVVGARILGLSEMPNCESRTMLFATGNNVGFAGDMARRGITCELDAREERPELRKFQHNARKRAGAGRGKYIAAAFTIVRAHIAAGSPSALDPIGSYEEWCSRVRDPLVWLGLPDPGASMSRNFEKDDVFGAIREFFALWPDYLRLHQPYEVSQIIHAGKGPPAVMPLNALGLFLARAAGIRGKPGEISDRYLGAWLKSICGRTVDGRRLVRGHDPVTRGATYALE
jgi:putative DNA primase/helicase